MPLNIYVSSVFTNDKHRTRDNRLKRDNDRRRDYSNIENHRTGNIRTVDRAELIYRLWPNMRVHDFTWKGKKKNRYFIRRNSFEIIYLLCRYFALIHRLSSALIFFPANSLIQVKRIFLLFFFSIYWYVDGNFFMFR